MADTPDKQDRRPLRRRRRVTALRGPLRWALVTGFIVAFGYVYVGGGYGLYHLWRLRRQKIHLEQKVSALEAKRFDLTQELQLLQQDPKKNPRLRFRLEELAREEYGMVRKGEMVYRFFPEEEKRKNSTED